MPQKDNWKKGERLKWNHKNTQLISIVNLFKRYIFYYFAVVVLDINNVEKPIMESFAARLSLWQRGVNHSPEGKMKKCCVVLRTTMNGRWGGGQCVYVCKRVSEWFVDVSLMNVICFASSFPWKKLRNDEDERMKFIFFANFINDIFINLMFFVNSKIQISYLCVLHYVYSIQNSYSLKKFRFMAKLSPALFMSFLKMKNFNYIFENLMEPALRKLLMPREFNQDKSVYIKEKTYLTYEKTFTQLIKFFHLFVFVQEGKVSRG